MAKNRSQGNVIVQSASRPEISAREFAERRATIAQRVAERDLAALVVFARGGTTADFYGDVLYLCNHHSMFPPIPDSRIWCGRGHSAVVVPASGPCVLVTDYVEDPHAPIHIDDVRVSPMLPQEVGRTLKDLGLADGTLGITGRESLPLAIFQEIEREVGHDLDATFADEIVERERLIKSETELELMRAAAAVGVEWMNTTINALVEGRTEGDAVGDGLRSLAANGGMLYDVAIASGSRSHHYFSSSSLPHWDSERELQVGDLVHADTWGPVNGYYTDLARSTVIGRKPTVAQAEVLEGSVALVQHIIDGVRPGITLDELVRRGDSWLLENGFADDEEQPTYGLYGHSLGLGTERPWIMKGEQARLEQNMVIAVETIVSRPGVGASNFEQSMIVTETGAEILTEACPSRWWD